MIKFTERVELLLALDNRSILVYFRGKDNIENIEFVIDAHLYSIGNIFVIKDKHALISTSEDRSVRMVEFQAFYPGQMIRRELTNLNHVSIKNKIEISKNNNNNMDTNDEDNNDNNINENYSNRKLIMIIV